MDLNREIVSNIEDPVALTATTGFLKNNGVDVKHEVALLARVSANGPHQRYPLADRLEQGYGVKFSFSANEKVLDYSFFWRDDSGRVRYSTESKSAPSGRYFSSIGGWWMTDPDAPKAQSFIPYSMLG